MRRNRELYLGLALTAFLVYIAVHYWSAIESVAVLSLKALVPIIIGGAVAFVLNIPMSFLEKTLFGKAKGKFAGAVKRPVCMILSIGIVALLIYLIITLVVSKLTPVINLLVQKLPPMLTEAYNALDEKFGVSDLFTTQIRDKSGDVKTYWTDLVKNAVQVFVNGFGGVVGSVFSIVSGVFSTTFSTVISVCFSLYVLAGKEKLREGFHRVGKAYIKPKARNTVLSVLSVFNDSFRRFIVGQVTEACILGVLCFLGMLICRFPYASMIGTLIGFSALIPIAGAFIGAAVGFVLVLSEGSVVQALLFLVFILILQQLEGNLIYPHVVGSSVGLPTVWVLTAITLGGSLYGIPGMLLCVPIAAALYRLLTSAVMRREQESAARQQSSDRAAPSA